MDKIYNFAAAPAVLPDEVVKQAREELFSYKKSGAPVMEIHHRSKEYDKIRRTAEDSLRRLLNIPSNYKVLFMPGSPSSQFSAIPMNLLSEHKCADYIVSGQSSDRAMKEAKKYGDIAIAATSAGSGYSTVPDTERSDFRPDADYVHLCSNNTVYGTRFHYIPDTGNIPLVADMTSSLLSEPIDVNKFGLIYAGSSFNIGSSGFTIVIIREDLLGSARPDTPASLNYKAVSETSSLYAIPSANELYMANLVFDWLISIGGLEEIKRRNERKASLIYDYLDGQKYYTATVDKKCRSISNIIFTSGSAEIDKSFVKEAEKSGLKNLEGHPSVGGMRASVYNGMSSEGVQKLVAFMKRFALENPKF